MDEYIKKEDVLKYLSFRRKQVLKSPLSTLDTKCEVMEAFDFVDHIVDVADVAPVRHGKWTTTSGEVFPGSSQCLCYSHKHEECGFQYVDMNENEYDFCPHCGAKMDGGEKDG